MVAVDACQVKPRHVYGRKNTVFRQATDLDILNKMVVSANYTIIQGDTLESALNSKHLGRSECRVLGSDLNIDVLG